jgi:hypothetical protein
MYLFETKVMVKYYHAVFHLCVMTEQMLLLCIV